MAATVKKEKAPARKRGARRDTACGRGSDGRELPRVARDGKAAEQGAPASGGQAGCLHIPVLLREVMAFFEPRPGWRVLDATLGLGGHSLAMMAKAREDGIADVRLLGLDRDQASLSRARERLTCFGAAVHTWYGCFSDCDLAVREAGWDGVDFALADIGVSSVQIDTPERGFSFLADGPLDMRMDPGRGQSAETLVNEAPVAVLRDLIRNFGEDPMAGRIARAIDDARAESRITSTLALARIVEKAYPTKWRATSRNHPATRTFQALRMTVNDELGELETFLGKAVSLLRPGGCLAVITFHSLEDRMVKHFFRSEATACRCPTQVPICVCGHRASLEVLTRKPVGPSPEEAASNPRACSAKLRVARRLDHER